MDSTKSHDDLLGIMERTAVESSGRVGSLYDGYRDHVLEQLQVNTIQNSPAKNSASCELIDWNADKSRNLLQIIVTEVDLRINILLNPATRTNVAALIDHPHSLNAHTRLLYYTYVHHIDQLDTTADLPDLPDPMSTHNTATHIITDVSWGINAMVILQLPSEPAETVTAIDDVLGKIRIFLEGHHNDTIFSLQDEELFEKNVKTKVYSNIPGLRSMTSVFTMCQYINGRSKQFNLYHSLKYLLKPIIWFYPQYSRSGVSFSPLPSLTMDNLEQHLIQLLDTVKKLKYSLDGTINDLSHEYLQKRVCEVQQEWITLSNTYEQEKERIQKLINNIRSGCNDISEINKALEPDTLSVLNNCIETLTRNIHELKLKRQLITSLHEQHFEYYNVAKVNVNQETYVQILLRNLAIDQKETRILCSNDTLNKKRQSKLDDLRNQLIQEYEINQNLHLVYADFSDSPIRLPDMMILPSNKSTTNTARQKDCLSSSTKEDIINILLLGESGVGKSTFINAFVNYLLFETLEKAESNKPVVLIPVSFLITTGDNFEERIINFGHFDDSNNEDFDHPGQSVTQHCKSYLFTLKHTNGRKLRIIDTPGFGDTRGIDQDDTNMQHILKYINNISHFNAICFLLKPNAAQLNNYFPICLTQLLDLLGPEAHQHIIYCFTNARSTFYTPGDTAPLLKTMLKSLSIDDIPFKKENVFCFDNESFRYLVALQYGIDFLNNEQKYEYDMSWSTSVKESTRLVSYVNNQLNVYPLHHKRQSIKHAEIEIMQMIRPMLEAMRNILRHIVLYNMRISNKSIKLKPTAISGPASRCNACQLYPVKVGDFLIASDDPQEIHNHCYHCSCISSQHSSIDYLLQYELLGRSVNYNRKAMDGIIQQLRVASNKFAYFLIHMVRSTKQDPFSIGLANMVKEENQLCQIQTANNLNSELVENLRKLQNVYEQNRIAMNSNKKPIELSIIYLCIEKVRTLLEVREQMVAVKQSQENLMEEYEYVVSEDLMK